MWLLTQVAPPDGGKPIMIRVPPGKHGVGRKDQPVRAAARWIRGSAWLASTKNPVEKTRIERAVQNATNAS